MIASIEATSAGLAFGMFDVRGLIFDLATRRSDFDIECWVLSVGRFVHHFQDFARRIVPGNAANRAAAVRA